MQKAASGNDAGEDSESELKTVKLLDSKPKQPAERHYKPQ